MTENMKDLNFILLEGRCGKDAEVRNGADGTPSVVTFSLATASSHKDKSTQEWIEDTEWHNVKVFGRGASYAANAVRKGCSVRVTGRVHYNSFTGADGVKRTSTEIIADNVVCCHKREAPTQPPRNQPVEYGQKYAGLENKGVDNDIPF